MPILSDEESRGHDHNSKHPNLIKLSDLQIKPVNIKVLRQEKQTYQYSAEKRKKKCVF